MAGQLSEMGNALVRSYTAIEDEGQSDLVSGDAPGTASRYLEESLDGKIVALWSSGAACCSCGL